VSLDTWPDIWNRVLLRAPDVGPLIAQDFVRNAFRRVAEKRRWSWLIKFSQFISPNVYSTGTANVTQGSAVISGNGTAWTSATPSLLFQQFRVGVTSPIYTIIEVTDDTHLVIDSAFGGVTQSAVSYQVYTCFFPTPTDYFAMLTLWDPQNNWQLNPNVKQEELNAIDAQRANFGQAYVVSYRDTSIEYSGYTGGPGVPRMELWPHAPSRTYPFLYESRHPDLNDTGATLPRFIRGDVLLEGALTEAAFTKKIGTRDNTYYDPIAGRYHDQKYMEMVAELERQDDEVDMQDLIRSYGVPSAFAVPWGDSYWLQTHGPLTGW